MNDKKRKEKNNSQISVFLTLFPSSPTTLHFTDEYVTIRRLRKSRMKNERCYLYPSTTIFILRMYIRMDLKRSVKNRTIANIEVQL